MGLVNGAFPDEELPAAVDDVARRTAGFLPFAVATGPTAAFALSKQLVQRLEDAGMAFDTLLAAEATAQGAASRTADYREALAACFASALNVVAILPATESPFPVMVLNICWTSVALFVCACSSALDHPSRSPSAIAKPPLMSRRPNFTGS